MDYARVGLSSWVPKSVSPSRAVQERLFLISTTTVQLGWIWIGHPSVSGIPRKNGRGYVAARRPDGNATTLKSILAQAPGHEVWLKDGDQYNLRRDNFELHDRRVRRAKSDAK